MEEREGNYWTRSRISRRSALRGGAIGVAGIAGAALIGCGDDGDDGDDATAAPAATSAAVATAEATAVVAATGPKSGGTLIWGMETDIDPIDPHTVNSWATWRVNYQLGETLVAKDLSVDTGGGEQPDINKLAESVERSPDGLDYVFKLRPNVRFHDGTDFNAEAVALNWSRFFDKDYEFYYNRAGRRHRYMNQYLQSWEVIDDLTIKFINDRPFGDFLEMMRGYFNPAMVSPTQVEKLGNDGFPTHPIGTGPFKFKEREEGQRIVFERNEDYWGENAYLDQIIWRPLAEPVSRVTSLQTGETDLIFVPPPDTIEQLLDGGFKVALGPTPHIWYMNPNQLNPLMRDIRVRQALSMAINKEGMATDLLRDTVTPAHQMHAPGAPAHNPSYQRYSYDPAEAKKMLSAAGHDQMEFNWWFAAAGSGNILPVQMAEWIQRDLAEIDVTMQITAQEWIAYLGALNDLLKQEDTAAYQMSWGMSNNFWLNIMAHQKWRTPEFPGTWWWEFDSATSNQVASTLDKAEVETDPEGAVELYREVNSLVMDAAWWIPIVHDSAPVAMKEEVQGFVHATEETYDFRGVWLDT
jgi:peptide/nickel transport system substrate-binding protein